MVQQGVSAVWRLCVASTAIHSVIAYTACSAPGQNSPGDSPTPMKDITSSQVVALGKLIPEGDVIKISVVNGQDSRVNQILVKEGDFVPANQVIAVLQEQNQVEQQLPEAQANVAIQRAQLLKIQQGDFKQGEIIAQKAAIAELTARLSTETKQRQATIAQAAATMGNAQLKYQRYATLAAAGAIQRAELDNAEEQFERTEAILAENRVE